MAAKSFNINQDEIIKFTKKLDKLHKSALPLAIRSTLNDTAFEAKKMIPDVFGKKFTVRKKNFIRSHTTVNKTSNTFSVNQMFSSVGVIKNKSEAGNELEAQEKGGTIKNRDFIPLDSARIGKSERKLVSKRNYLKKIKGKKGQKAHTSNQYRKAAFRAGKGGSIIFNNILLRIDVIKKSKKGLFIKSTALYDFKNNRSVRIKKTPFIEPSAKLAQKKMPELYKKNAEFRIRKALKK